MAGADGAAVSDRAEPLSGRAGEHTEGAGLAHGGDGALGKRTGSGQAPAFAFTGTLVFAFGSRSVDPSRTITRPAMTAKIASGATT